LAGRARGTNNATGNIRYGIKNTVVRNTTFNGNNAIETRTETTYVDTLAGLPPAGLSISLLSYSQVQGAEILNYGSTSQVSQSGLTINTVTRNVPPIRSFINWTAGVNLTQTYTSTSESTGLPVAVPPAVTTTTTTTRYLGRETITVPAGTFDACRFETTTNGTVATNWSAATGRYWGLLLRAQDNATGDAVQATRLLFNGS
jgi:hypothetical protein